MQDQMVLVGSGRDSSLPMKIDLKDINLKPVIIYSNMYESFSRQLNEKLKQKETEILPAFEADNVGTLKRVIESGLGWGFMPEHSIRKQLRSGRLTQIQVDDLNYITNVNMYYKALPEFQKMADVFYRAIQQQALNK